MTGAAVLSNHRQMELHRLVAGREPESVRVMSGCVVLRYEGLAVMVSRRTWRVTVPGCPAEAEYLESLGCPERARLAVERAEGAAAESVPHASRSRLVAAQEAMRRALA